MIITVDQIKDLPRGVKLRQVEGVAPEKVEATAKPGATVYRLKADYTTRCWVLQPCKDQADDV